MYTRPCRCSQITLTTEQQKLLDSISSIIGWTDFVYKGLANSNSITYSKWLKVVNKYYTDTLNAQTNNARREIYNALVWQTAAKLSVTQEIINTIFKEGKKLNYPSLKIDYVLARYDSTVTDKLITKKGLNEFVNLALRYYVLTITEGLFLSLPKELYTQLLLSSQLPVLECYASPFNHCLTDYCSLFAEDVIYGALPRFDQFIDMIHYPVRLVLNPPYTPRIMQICITKLLAYMNREKGEFIMVMPIMYNFPELNELLSYNNTAYTLLQYGMYTLHSFMTCTDIVAPMKLYIVANIEGSYQKSVAMVNNIALHLREGANRLAVEI